MRRAAMTSGALHVVVIAIAFFGLPSLFRSDIETTQPVSVELVALAPEVAAPPPKPKPEPPKAKPQPRPKPPPKVEAPRPAPPLPPPMALDPELEQPPPPPKAKPEPKPKPKPKAKPKPPPPKAVRVAPRPRAKPPPPPDPLQALLRNLAKQSQRQRRVEAPKTEPEPETKQLQVASVPQRSETERRQLAAGLAQLVERQIRQCWNVPGGAKGVQEMLIEIHIRLNPDGTLRGMPEVADARRMDRDPVYRTVAESALRAVRDPRCSPLQLPYSEYGIWKEITLNFDPRKALGQ